MGKATLYLLAEKPIFGAGRYAYKDFVDKYVKKGLLNPAVSKHGHPHNILFSAAFFKGLLGVIIVLAIFIYTLWFFSRKRHIHLLSSDVGIIFLLCVFMVQLTASAILIKGNFIVVFLVILSVLFSNKIQEINKFK